MSKTINTFLLLIGTIVIGCGENSTATHNVPTVSTKTELVQKQQDSQVIKSVISTLSFGYYQKDERWYISPLLSSQKVNVYSLMGFKNGVNGWGTVGEGVASVDLKNERITIGYIKDNHNYTYYDQGWKESHTDPIIQSDIEKIRNSTVNILWWFFQANGSWFIINKAGDTWKFSTKNENGVLEYDWIKIDMGGVTPDFFIDKGVKKIKFTSGDTEPSNQTQLMGIDVSHNNGSINWLQVKNDNISFAFIKATEGYPETDYEKSHESSLKFVDSRFKENMDNAINAGLIVAPYHFIRVDYNNKISEARESARYFVSKIKPYYDNYQMLPPVIDLENPLYSKEYAQNRNQIGRWSKKEFSDWIRAFASEVESALGRKPILYMNESFSDSEVDQSIRDNYKLWIAKYMFSKSSEKIINNIDDLHQYNVDFKPNKDFTFWQFTETATDVNGMNLYVDKDVFYGSLNQLKSL